MRRDIQRLLVAVTVLAALTSTLLYAQAPGGAPAPNDALAGKLPDGSNYRVVKPPTWNGTLVLDLDFANNPAAQPSATERWMTANGYAIGGISREPVAYRFPQAVDDLLAVRTMFIERWGATPTRTLTLGVSRGGFVSRVAMELRPDVFVGAVMSAGGGAGELAVHNAKLDTLWTLKQLAGVPLTLVGFANQADALAENGRIQAAVTDLRKTPLGRARLALAAAFEQFPTWTEGDEPPAAGDYEAQLDQIANAFAFANPGQVRYGVEVIAGGNFSWNHGVDYADLLAKSGMSPLVTAMYAKAGTSLQADLQTLASAPRISATAAAVAAAEKTTSYSGKIAGPVIVVDNIGDPVDADAYKKAYESTVTRAGKGELLRTTWVRSARHANQSALERIAGFTKLIERLDTGRWSDTSPQAMTARAQEIARASAIDLGPSRFIAHEPLAALRPWDGANWGTYRPPVPAAGAQAAPAPAAPVANAAPAGDVIGIGTFIHSVADANRTFAFYNDLLGLPPAAMPRVFAPNEVVANLYGAPGTPYRGGTLRLPNTELAGVEFGDWQGIERHPVRPSLQAPGAAILLLSVRDLDPLVELVKKNGGAVVTPGGAPKAFTAATAGPMKGRAVMVTDPDGFFIQLTQLDPLPAAAATATTNVIGAGLAFTVANATATMQYYRDALGFEAGVPAALYAAGGMSFVPATVSAAAMRAAATRVPGTAVPLEFLQVASTSGAPFQPTIRDPGAGMLRLRVRDIDTTFAKLKGAGATASSVNGAPVLFANGQRMVVMHDPNNFFVQPVMAAPPAAPRPQ